MIEIKTPGVYVSEAGLGGSRSITGTPMSRTAIMGWAADGPENQPTMVRSVTEFTQTFGQGSKPLTLEDAVVDFFLNGGMEAMVVRLSVQPVENGKPAREDDWIKGLEALAGQGGFELLYLASGHGVDVPPGILAYATRICVKHRAFHIIDPPTMWQTAAESGDWQSIRPDSPEIGIPGDDGRNAAVYFPSLVGTRSDGSQGTYPPGASVAGIAAATDAARGIWKAPAGVEASLSGAQKTSVTMTDSENGLLNPLGINCLRTLQDYGTVVWGARTLRGSDQLVDDYRYISVRRLILFVESSLDQGLEWVVFEPNDESLWASVRQSAETFLQGLYRQGAFYDYRVVCDESTNSPEDISQGRLNCQVTLAPVNPAEFVVLMIQKLMAKAEAT